MGTDSDTLSLYIRASTDLQRSYAVAVDYVRSVALRNAITWIGMLLLGLRMEMLILLSGG